MKFVLASHNKGKLAEMQAILGELGVEVVMPAEDVYKRQRRNTNCRWPRSSSARPRTMC